MYLEYTNRHDDKHYLKSVINHKGTERYYILKDISKVDKKELLAELPKGFEWYDMPEDSRVVLRKIQKSIITKDEIEIVTEVMKEYETAKKLSKNV